MVTVTDISAQKLLQTPDNPVIMDMEMDVLRADLEDLERRLIPLLVAVQKALGKEPSVMTRAEKRQR